jgi:hypothetical protein
MNCDFITGVIGRTKIIAMMREGFPLAGAG